MMKRNLQFLILLGFLLGYSQKKETKSFSFENIEVEYLRLDYSKYGIAHFFVTTYNENTVSNLIEEKAIGCLKGKSRLYHTLYFFLKIPKSISDETSKTKLFSEFMSHIEEEEKIMTYNLYLNADINYSIPYQLSGRKIERIITGVTPRKICKTLTIR